MRDFHLTGSEWDAAAAEMEAVGRQRYEGDRTDIEIMCGAFVLRRSKFGKKLPAPTKHKKAWMEAHKAAVKLRDKLRALKDMPDAASFDVLSWPGEDGFDHLAFIQSLDEFIPRSAFVAGIEGMGPTSPNASDMDRDWLLAALIGFWAERGGSVGSSIPSSGGEPGGPLVRFLAATYGPALVCAGMDRPSATHIRDEIRKYQGRCRA